MDLGFEINNLPGEGYVFINAENIEIDYEDSIQDIITHEVELNEQTGTEQQAVTTEREFNNKSELRQVKAQHLGIKKLFFESLFWEVLLGLIVGAVVFFFIYREAFECFECFGVGGG